MEDCKDPILLFKIPMVTREEFCDIYKQFGNVPSESIASPALFITKAKNPRRCVSTPIYVLAV
jgi:hypothetical protein